MLLNFDLMLDTLITSKTRIKLLIKFFLNSSSKSYLRNLEQEFGESSNAIRVELNKLEEAGLLQSETNGNRKYFSANTHHPLFPDIHNILLKYIGVDKVIDTVVTRIGDLKEVYLIGEIAKGVDSKLIDLAFVGKDIDKEYLVRLIEKAEALVKRKIRFMVFEKKEMEEFLESKQKSDYLLLYKS